MAMAQNQSETIEKNEKNNNGILIAGGAGYIGSHINRALALKGKKTVVLDNLSRGYKERLQWGKFIGGSVGEVVATMGELLNEHKIQTVFYLATYCSIGESFENPDLYYQNNVEQLMRFLRAAKNSNVKNIIYTSTAAVYGQVKEVPIPEHQSILPISPYGHSKAMAERILKDVCEKSGISYVILRPINVAGAASDQSLGEMVSSDNQVPRHILPRLLQCISNKKEFTIFGNNFHTSDGTCIRDYVHVEDVVRAHLLALEYLEKGGDNNAFDLGTGVGTSVLQLVQTVEEIVGNKITVNYAPAREGDPVVMLGRSEKTRVKLGWDARFGIDDIVLSSYNYFKAFKESF